MIIGVMNLKNIIWLFLITGCKQTSLDQHFGHMAEFKPNVTIESFDKGFDLTESHYLFQENIGYPLNTISLEEKLLVFATNKNGKEGYILELDKEGNIRALQTSHLTNVENIVRCNQNIIACRQVQSHEVITLADENGAIQSEISFAEKNILLGPIAFCYFGKPAILWTSGDESTSIWFSTIEEGKLASPVLLATLDQIVYEIAIAPTKNDNMYLALSMGDDLELRWGELTRSGFSLLTHKSLSPAVGINPVSLGNSFFVSYVSNSTGNDHSALILTSIDGDIRDTIASFSQKKSVFTYRIFSQEPARLIISLIVKVTDPDSFSIIKEKDASNRRIPKIKFEHYIVQYDRDKRSSKILAKITPPGMPYHAGYLGKKRLFLIHGMEKPILSIFKIDSN